MVPSNVVNYIRCVVLLRVVTLTLNRFSLTLLNQLLSPPGTIMHMLFPFSKMLSKFFVVSFPLSWSRSYSIASSRTQFTYTSNPFKVPVNSLCPFFMIIQTFSLTHLSTSSDGRRREGLFGAADCFVGNAMLLYYREGGSPMCSARVKSVSSHLGKFDTTKLRSLPPVCSRINARETHEKRS